MKDLIDSLRLQIFERLSSPLGGAFCIAWLIWNHLFFFIMFSDMQIEDRIALAKSELFPNEWAVMLRGVLCPFVTAVVFILVYPYPAKWFYSYWHKRQVEIKELRDKIEGAVLLTRDEARNLRLELSAKKVEFEEQYEAQQAEIDRLKALLNATPDNPPSPEKVETTQVDQEYEAAKLKIVEFIVKTSDSASVQFSSLFDHLKLNKHRLEHYLRLLANQQMIRDESGTSFGRRIRLTERGRAFAVEKGIV